MFRFLFFIFKPRCLKSTIRSKQTLAAISTIACVILFTSSLEISSNCKSAAVSSADAISLLSKNPHDICQGNLKITRILLVLRIDASYSHTRTYIREKNGNSSQCRVRAVFLYGKFTGSKAGQLQDILNREKEAYIDIVQFRSVEDYKFNEAQTAVDSMKPWVSADPCVVYQQVAFGTFQLSSKPRRGKEERSWDLDECLKFSIFKRTNVQFFAHYYPPLLPHDVRLQVSKDLAQSLTYEYGGSIAIKYQISFLIEPSEGDRTFGYSDTPANYLAVIVVHSSVSSFAQRKLVRSTWGHPKIQAEFKIRVLFFLGRKQSDDPEEITQLKNESIEHQDLVQGDFIDSYKNMTLKQISILKYLTEKCPHLQYKYLFKTDDDIVIDLYSITRYISMIQKVNPEPQRTIHCFHMNELATVPRYADKWYVSRSEYPDDLYPAYCSGAGYLLTKDLVSILFQASRYVKTFWVDDTYISGILPQAVGDVSIIQIPKQSLDSLKSLWKNGGVDHKMIVHVQQDPVLFQIYWNKIQHSIS